MALRFYNTLTLQLQPFAPAADNTVRMYTCGPTVYDFAHIGKYLIFSGIMAVAVSMIHNGNAITSLIIKILTGAMVYATLVVIFDKGVRERIRVSLSGKEIAHEAV